MGERKPYVSRWVIVGICFAILALTYGVWYSFSVFFVALLKEFGWSRSTGAGAFSLFIVVQSILGPLSGAMVDRFGPRRVILSGSVILGAGLALSSTIESWWQFYIYFGVITATGLGTTGWIANSTIVQQWFREKRGLAIGIISSGIGVGILVCTPLTQYLIDRVGWRTTYQLMGCFIPLFNASMAIPFLKKAEPEKELRAPVTIAPAFRTDWAVKAWTAKEAMATRQFWMLTSSFLLTGVATQSVLTHHVAFFVDRGLPALFASYIAGILGIVSIGGKILSGTLSDRIGRELTFTTGVFFAVCGLVSLISFQLSSFYILPYTYALFFGMGYAAVAALPAIITADFFAGRSYGTIFGTIMILNGAGGAFGAWFAGFIHDRFHSYLYLFLLTIACFITAGYAVWIAAPRKVIVDPGKRRA